MATKIERIEAFQKERLGKVQYLLYQFEVDIILITDHRIRHWIGKPEVKYVLVTSDGIDVCEDLIQYLGNKSITVGVDGYLTASDFLELEEKLSNIKWISVARKLSDLMAVKDRLEILMLRKSAEITHAVFREIEQNLTPNRSELDLLYTAYKTMATSGGNGFSFEPSIGSGPRSTLIYAGVETRKLVAGDPLVVDLGVSFRGYQSDMTCSYLIEDIDNQIWKNAYLALKEVMETIKDNLRPGVTGGKLHEICTNALQQLGYLVS
ncbi:M24 family metallopeptidase [Tengunoibacter tsumagoiensis]|uniref:Peptidase M24 domain-containing protein n=1 Tax=Tengunoibacter tsumagoiensis TaxID=2014871 RepID=A0A401ZUL8_9CHLR|nr:M24 family metallopeptidase [Tengunoibacter tsumagoiensis]GCE10573.1 hypothetical protein KTT_04320 [Tengunoibacter tsumagoiensis]